ncbi:MAG: hypothetical protein QNK37_20675 [Acidobacteriota bacterium]|nr:hypothetical protein [Acidobacteriota bacterium]
MAKVTEFIKYVVQGEDRTKDMVRSIKRNVRDISKNMKSLANNKVEQAFGGIQAGLGGIWKKILGIGAAWLAAWSFKRIATGLQNTLQRLDKMHKLAIKLDTDAEFLSSMEYVMNLNGVAVESFNTALQRMVKRIGQAKHGTGEARWSFFRLGLQVQDLYNMNPEQQFLAIADALSKVQNNAEKIAFAEKIFDSEGVPLLQSMTEGAEGIRKLQKEAKRLGLVITQDMVETAATANDEIFKLKWSFEQLKNVLTVEVAPAIGKLAETLRSELPTFVDFSKKIGKSLLVSLVLVFNQFVSIFSRVSLTLGSFFTKAAGFVTSFVEVTKSAFDQLHPNLYSLLNLEALTGFDPLLKLSELMQEAGEGWKFLGERQEDWAESANLSLLNLLAQFSKVTDSLEKETREQIESFVEINNFLESATKNLAVNLNSTFKDFFFDPFDKGLKGLLNSFVDALRQMAAQMAASQLMQWLGGFLFKQGSSTGFWSGLGRNMIETVGGTLPPGPGANDSDKGGKRGKNATYVIEQTVNFYGNARDSEELQRFRRDIYRDTEKLTRTTVADMVARGQLRTT